MKKICSLAFAGIVILSASLARAGTFTENFSTNPQRDGWKIFGDTNFFHWNSTNQNLEVTWDSSQTNSYFYLPLGTILAKDDDFSLTFDLRLSDFVAGNDRTMPSTFPLSIGFLNLAEAQQTNFLRGTGYTSPDIVEFDFFPDPGGSWKWGPSLTASMVDSTAFDWSSGGFDPDGLTSNDVYEVSLTYTAANSNLVMNITQNGALFVSNVVASLNDTFTDFRADAISISSYSQAGQDTTVYTNSDGSTTIYAGSILAHGTVSNIVVTIPPPPVQNFSANFAGNILNAQLLSRSNWLYTLERTADFQSWTNVSDTIPGNATNLFLQDTNPPVDRAFYRVKAERP
jgi:hypothetical protein